MSNSSNNTSGKRNIKRRNIKSNSCSNSSCLNIYSLSCGNKMCKKCCNCIGCEIYKQNQLNLSNQLIVIKITN